MAITLHDLKRHAIGSSLFQATTLGRAVRKLGFVQADPIRSPARAQDLILRQRVIDYRVGDLDRDYVKLKLEEDVLYAYGFVPQSMRKLLHPRGQRALTEVERKVLEAVSSTGRFHPRNLEEAFGKGREVNAWGGYSKATTRCLERLHYMGLIGVSGRENGVKVYRRISLAAQLLSNDDRLRELILIIANLLAPVPASSLRAALRHLAHSAPDLPGRESVLRELLQDGSLNSAHVDGTLYVWPTRGLIGQEPGEIVRFLAPFDPLVWDRRRFELFWGWPYRFEAYTPIEKRKFGYYAMPILWRTDVIGWVNVSGQIPNLSVAPHFHDPKYASDPSFQRAFADEVCRFSQFLNPSAR